MRQEEGLMQTLIHSIPAKIVVPFGKTKINFSTMFCSDIKRMTDCYLYCDNNKPILYSRPFQVEEIKNKMLLFPDGLINHAISFDIKGTAELTVSFSISESEKNIQAEDLTCRCQISFS